MPIGLKGNSDGSGAIQIGGSDAISITTGLNTTFAGTVTATGTVAGSTGTLYPLTSGTAVASTSGTAIDFTSIPSWVKRITVMFQGVSTNGASDILVQVGTSSGFNTVGYLGASTSVAGTGAATSNYTTGFGIRAGGASGAAAVRHGHVVITNITSNTWVASGVIAYSDTTTSAYTAGTIALGATLDRVRITSVTPDTFDAGSINILYE